MKRYQKTAILKDLPKKMVFLAGPRQAGKTTLAKEIARDFKNSTYLNYDASEDKKIISDSAWLPKTELLVLDEIHKMPEWKNYLKGLYDTKPDHLKILVTGSARPEIFNHVGDSLAGRFFLHRLMPLSPAELKKVGLEPDIDRFLEMGNFPEPYLADDLIDAKRWRAQYIDSLLRVDVLDLDNIQNLKAIRLVFDLLRERVGSPLSMNSIAKDVGISPNTVKKYLHILEALYIIFRVSPYSKNIARSLAKEPKIYFFDTGLIKGDSGVKFENFVAACLFKHTLALVDYQAEDYKLHYLRTKDGQEVDFALVKEGDIESMIEVKNKNNTLGKGLLYFSKKYEILGCQVVKNLKQEKVQQDIQIVNGTNFLENLFL